MEAREINHNMVLADIILEMSQKLLVTLQELNTAKEEIEKLRKIAEK